MQKNNFKQKNIQKFIKHDFYRKNKHPQRTR
jgi:hypothetical protein